LREYQEQIRISIAHFTDFIHVPRFPDGCSKIVGEVRHLFLLHAFQTLFLDILSGLLLGMFFYKNIKKQHIIFNIFLKVFEHWPAIYTFNNYLRKV
jgi:hypothetical protein